MNMFYACVQVYRHTIKMSYQDSPVSCVLLYVHHFFLVPLNLYFQYKCSVRKHNLTYVSVKKN